MIVKYFAYGSNMSEKRMKDRKIVVYSKILGILEGYDLLINKKSYKNPSLGFANVVKNENNNVEGVLYDVDENQLSILDKFEGAPKHYRREIMKIKVGEEYVDGVVYVANENWTTTNELKTTKEYKNFILEGKHYLSDEYYFKLLNIKTI